MVDSIEGKIIGTWGGRLPFGISDSTLKASYKIGIYTSKEKALESAYFNKGAEVITKDKDGNFQVNKLDDNSIYNFTTNNILNDNVTLSTKITNKGQSIPEDTIVSLVTEDDKELIKDGKGQYYIQTTSKIEETKSKAKILGTEQMIKEIDKLTGNTRSTRSNVKLLVNGPQAFKEIDKVLDSAKKSINIQIFIFHDDETGWAVARKLVEKARQGIDVRLLYDEGGTISDPGSAKILEYLRENGVKTILEPMFGTPIKTKLIKRLLPFGVDEGLLATATDLLMKYNNHDHRKLIVVDGKTAILGGMNFGDEYGKENNWHDLMVRIDGESVKDAQRAFISSWQRAGGKIESLEKWKELFPSEDTLKVKEQNAPITRILASNRSDNSIKTEICYAIDNAQKNIYIANAYVTDEEIIKKIKEAAARGVKVKMVFSDKTDVPIIDQSHIRNMNKLFKAGVEIYVLNTENRKRMIHAKTMTVDGIWSTVGSCNFTNRALNYNQEINVSVIDKDFASSLEERVFNQDLKDAVKMTKELPEKLYYRISEVLSNFA